MFTLRHKLLCPHVIMQPRSKVFFPEKEVGDYAVTSIMFLVWTRSLSHREPGHGGCHSFDNFVLFFPCLLDVEINDPEAFVVLGSSQMASVIGKNLKYFTKQGGKWSLRGFNETYLALEVCLEFLGMLLKQTTQPQQIYIIWLKPQQAGCWRLQIMIEEFTIITVSNK